MEPSDPAVTIERLEKELGYYRRRTDELAGENLNLDYKISGLRQELNQKRRGFALLSELQQAIGAEQQASAIFQRTIHTINATLGMDRTVVLVPTGEDDAYRVAHWAGVPESAASALSARTFLFPRSFAEGTGILLVHKASEETPLVAELKGMLELTGFLCLPVMGETGPTGLLLSGRMREAKPLYPPLDQGDIDTFTAIAGLISSVVKNMRIAVLEEMDRLKTDFFANISHEFRTPITLTLGPLEGIAAGRYGEIPETLRTEIENMQRSQTRLLGLVNQILDLAKLEAGRLELRAARMANPNRFVAQRVDQFRSLAEKRGLDLRLATDDAVSGVDLFVDTEKFDKVIFNLLSNAHNFTTRGHIEVATEIVDGSFCLRVSDSGVGIKADQLPAIFDRFRQADGSASRNDAGTGIGLALAKEIVELHGGEIAVQSEYGKGTTFRARLPLGSAHLDPASIVETSGVDVDDRSTSAEVLWLRDPASDLEGEEDTNAATAANVDTNKPSILYADDNRDLRRYVRDLLAPTYNVYLAINGEDGLRIAKKHRPDLILSDVMMPVMSGVEFCRRARQDPDLRGLPFVLLTAKSSLESKVEGLEEGADDYLTKPFAAAELTARIKNLIALRKNQARLKQELLAARAIQQALLPPAHQRFEGAEVEALYHPSEELSGDFYDIVRQADWLYGYVADVTSHGTAAAQVTYVVRGIVRETLTDGRFSSLSELMTAVNERYAECGLEHDVAIQLVRLDVRKRVLEYVLGYAPPALHVSGGKGRVLSASPGGPLSARNATRRTAYEHGTASLAEGDCVYFFTDGCYEFDAAGRPYGRRRLYQLLEGAPSVPNVDWAASVREQLVRAKGGTVFEDDLTILRLRIT
jgi:signal transduction histidine kinase/serine phosphatase RsbU (regulator of sigma subunit)